MARQFERAKVVPAQVERTNPDAPAGIMTPRPAAPLNNLSQPLAKNALAKV